MHGETVEKYFLIYLYKYAIFLVFFVSFARAYGHNVS